MFNQWTEKSYHVVKYGFGQIVSFRNHVVTLHCVHCCVPPKKIKKYGVTDNTESVKNPAIKTQLCLALVRHLPAIEGLQNYRR